MLNRLIGLLLLSTAPFVHAQTPLANAPFQPDTDYTVIAQAQPTNSGDRIEVLEAFGYSCPHCGSIQPQMDNWKEKLPADVAFSYVPAAWGGVWEIFARAYYAAEVLGVLEKTHAALFNALHVEKQPIRSAEDVAAFYANYGVSKEDFLATMNSFAINAKIARSKQQLPRYGVSSTPTVIVAGKYLVSVPREGGAERMLQIVDYLIAQERTRKAG